MEVEGMDFVSEKGFYETSNALSVMEDFVPEKGFYQPSNDRTWESYQALYCVVDNQLGGGYPRTVVCGVADEILGIFRNLYMTQIQKQFEVEKLIGIISIDVFNMLVLSTNEIDDYNRAKEGETWRRQEEEEEEEEAYFYQPRTTETWRAYNSLLNAVVESCGVQQQPHLVLCCVANELIEVLKNVVIKEDDVKKRLIGDILNLDYVSDQQLKDLVAMVELITDYKPQEFVGPTDLMREDTLMMMMGEERKVVKRRRIADEEESATMLQSSSLHWSDGDGDGDGDGEEEEAPPMVELEDGDVVGPMKDDDDLMAQNENMGPVVEYHLVRDVKEKLVLTEVGESSEEDEDGWVMKNVVKKVIEKLVLNEVKTENEDEWVVV